MVSVQTIHMVGFGSVKSCLDLRDDLGRLPKFGRVQAAIIDFRIKTN